MPGSKWEQVFLENAGPVDEGFQLLALEKAFGSDAKEHRRRRLLLRQLPQTVHANAGVGGGFFKRKSRFSHTGTKVLVSVIIRLLSVQKIFLALKMLLLPHVFPNGSCSGFVIAKGLYCFALAMLGYVHYQMPVFFRFQPVFVGDTAYSVGSNAVHIGNFLRRVSVFYLRKR